jgi:ribosome-binding factor A
MAKNNSSGRSERGRGDNDDRDHRPGSKPKPKSPGTPAGPTQRMLRVGEMIRHELASVLARNEIHDEVLTATVVTIPEVRMSTDLKLATVYVMPLGGKNIEAVIEALNSHKKYIRSLIAKAINLKFAPEVRFRHDETFDEAMKIDRLLDAARVRQDLEKKD